MKTGYDLLNDRWPSEFGAKLGIDIAKLPRIVRPGAPIANVSKRASERLGLSTRTRVTGGSSDGYASALAWIMLVIITVVTALLFWSRSKWVYDE